MPEAGGRITVPVSQEEAWNFAADVRNAPRWVFGVREVAGDLRHPLLPGDHLKVRLLAGGRVADSEWTVGRCDRPTFLSSQGHALGATGTLQIECLALGPNSAEVRYRLSYQLPGGPLGALAGRFGIQGILDVQARHSLSTLRRLLTGAKGKGSPLRRESDESRSR
ncbi:MAG TPA: SRPBCC family protein [Candidatus Dormibacteraeota bacterium]|nr:SRPBCC family protein [Candidatus Dormibacteraeota bacterium]